MLNLQQIELIQTSWSKIVPIADQSAALFYEKLFALDPSLKPLFKNDFAEQGKKLITMLSLTINKLDDLESLCIAVRRLGERHREYGVEDKHYDTFGIALLCTLKESLGESFSADEQRAWAIAYATLTTMMKSTVEHQVSQVA